MNQAPPPTNPQGAEGEKRYANVWPRLLAFLLDNAICLVATLIVAGFIPADVYESDAAAVFAILVFTAWFNYFAIAEWRWGKTIGKSSLRLEVRADEGGRPSWNAAAIRNLMRIVDVLVIGPLLIASSPTRKRLGDRFAHTSVVQTKRAPAPVAAVPAGAHPQDYGHVAAPAPTTGPPPFHADVASPATPPSAAALSSLPPPPAPAVDLSALPPPPPPPASLAALPPPPPPVPGRPHPPMAGGPPAPKREEGIGILPPTWSIRELLLSIPIMIGGLIVVGVVIAIIDADAESPAALIVGQALLSILLGGIALGFASQGAGGLLAGAGSAFERLGLRRFKPSGLGLAAAAYVAYILFVAMVYSPFVQPEQQDITEDLGVDQTTLAAIAGGILIIVFAPISEEMFFRGFFYGALRTRMGLWPAAAISAGVFGLLHISSGDLSIVPPLVIFGLLLCWLYEYTGSLGPPIVLHMINNAIAFIVITTT